MLLHNTGGECKLIYYNEYRVMRNSAMDIINRFDKMHRSILDKEIDLQTQIAVMETTNGARNTIIDATITVLKAVASHNAGSTDIDIENALNQYALFIKGTRSELLELEKHYQEYMND